MPISSASHSPPLRGEPWLHRFVATQNILLSAVNGTLRCPRAMVVRPHPGAGLGNRLRVLACSLFLAALTERLLVFDYPSNQYAVSELRLLRPAVVQWDPSRFPSHLRGCWTSGSQHAPRQVDQSVLRLPFNGHGAFLRSEVEALIAPRVLLINGWNHDVTPALQRAPQLQAALRERRLDLGSFTHTSMFATQALAALFRPSQMLARMLSEARRGRNGIEAAVHVRVNDAKNASRNEQQWRHVARLMASCAVGLLRATAPGSGSVKSNATVYLASNEAYVVEEMWLAIKNTSYIPYALPTGAGGRSHSGFNHGHNATAALLDLLLLQAAERFVGTAGSSFSEHSMILGAGRIQGDPL